VIGSFPLIVVQFLMLSQKSGGSSSRKD